MTGWPGTRVLLTGAGGFIGANLTRRLLDLGAGVHAIVGPSSDAWRLEEVAARLVVHRVDLTDRAALDDAVRTAAPEVVFHLAARGAARHDIDAADLFHANVLGTLHLLAATRPHAYSRFVHVGGSSEYGPRQGALRESDRLEPVTPYGASKAAATLACQQFARAHGRPLVVLRPFSVYGPWESASRLIPTAIRAAMEDLPLPLTPPGYRRDLVFVDDVVDACVLAATRDLPAGEIINIGTGRQWSNERVVRVIETVTGRSIRTAVGQYRPRLSDTGHWVAEVSKAQEVLGWKAARTLEAGMTATVAWWGVHRDRRAAGG